ncbi:gamma-glutamyltransferase [Brevundimonas sp. M1A4_2e]
MARFVRPMLGALLATLLPVGAGAAHGESASRPALLDYGAIQHPVRAERAMVVSQNVIASQVGADILKRGGNAIDAAVGVGFALAVTLPRAGNLGGDGYMLAHIGETGETLVVDYRSIAPMAAHVGLFSESQGGDPADLRRGYRASGVPGTVAGLEAAHRRWGRLPWAEVVRPARRLAEDGVVLSRDEAEGLAWSRPMWEPYAAGRQAFLKADGSDYAAGERFVQPDLGWTLSQIEQGGAAAFYLGAVADRVVASMAENNGLITKADLAAYRPVFREPIEADYRGYRVVATPPSSSGGVMLLEMLNIVENFDLKGAGAGTAASLHLMAEAMKLAQLDRVRWIGDPDFSEVPTRQLVSQAFADQRARLIQPDRTLPLMALHPLDPWSVEGESTTHFSVVDAEGNVVSNTYTLGASYGSGAVIDGAGFLLNDQMKNFNRRMGPDGRPLRANGMEPGKRMISTMTPTVVFREGKPWLVTGTPGGASIPNSLFQLIVNMIDHDMTVAQATHAPRAHQDGASGRLQVEPGFNGDTADLLAQRGHRIGRRSTIGSIQSILIRPDGGLEGAADSRRPDAAAIAAD